MNIYFCVWIVGSFMLSVALTAAAMKVAPKLGLVDRPDGGRKRHANPTPLMGGVALYLTIASMVLLGVYTNASWAPNLGNAKVSAFVISGGLFCLLGLIDDRWAMRARTKFALQLVAAVPFALGGVTIDQIQLLGVHVYLGWTGIIFVTFWLTACANIVNLSDGMDGLAGSVSWVAIIAIGISAISAGQHSVSAVAWITAASLSGFLLFNWPPAKIFMGDAGSLTLGFVVGAFALQCYSKPDGFALAAPLVLLGIPTFDTAIAILRRKLNGQGIGEADRHHLHHRLQDHGLSRLQALLVIVSLCCVMAVGAVMAHKLNQDWIALAACIVALGSLIATRTFANHELATLVSRIRGISEVSRSPTSPLAFDPAKPNLDAKATDDDILAFPPSAESGDEEEPRRAA